MKIVAIIFLSRVSTSVKFQKILWEDCAISSALTATPPALAALPGANRTPVSIKYFVASIVAGIFAPSPTENVLRNVK